MMTNPPSVNMERTISTTDSLPKNETNETDRTEEDLISTTNSMPKNETNETDRTEEDLVSTTDSLPQNETNVTEHTEEDLIEIFSAETVPVDNSKEENKSITFDSINFDFGTGMKMLLKSIEEFTIANENNRNLMSSKINGITESVSRTMQSWKESAEKNVDSSTTSMREAGSSMLNDISTIDIEEYRSATMNLLDKTLENFNNVLIAMGVPPSMRFQTDKTKDSITNETIMEVNESTTEFTENGSESFDVATNQGSEISRSVSKDTISTSGVSKTSSYVVSNENGEDEVESVSTEQEQATRDEEHVMETIDTSPNVASSANLIHSPVVERIKSDTSIQLLPASSNVSKSASVTASNSQFVRSASNISTASAVVRTADSDVMDGINTSSSIVSKGTIGLENTAQLERSPTNLSTASAAFVKADSTISRSSRGGVPKSPSIMKSPSAMTKTNSLLSKAGSFISMAGSKAGSAVSRRSIVKAHSRTPSDTIDTIDIAPSMISMHSVKSTISNAPSVTDDSGNEEDPSHSDSISQKASNISRSSGCDNSDEMKLIKMTKTASIVSQAGSVSSSKAYGGFKIKPKDSFTFITTTLSNE